MDKLQTKKEIELAKAELEKALKKIDADEVTAEADLEKMAESAKALLDINGIC